MAAEEFFTQAEVERQAVQEMVGKEDIGPGLADRERLLRFALFKAEIPILTSAMLAKYPKDGEGTQCPDCHGNGFYQVAGPTLLECPTCKNGFRKGCVTMDCPKCGGTRRRCYICKGSGKIPGKCPTCGGTAKVELRAGATVECIRCSGTGRIKK